MELSNTSHAYFTTRIRTFVLFFDLFSETITTILTLKVVKRPYIVV